MFPRLNVDRFAGKKSNACSGTPFLKTPQTVFLFLGPKYFRILRSTLSSEPLFWSHCKERLCCHVAMFVCLSVRLSTFEFFSDSGQNFPHPKKRLFIHIFCLQAAYPAVGEARRDTMLPSILVSDLVMRFLDLVSRTSLQG